MSGAVALARATAAGIRLRLLPDGGVRMEAETPPPAAVLADLRRWRDEVAALVADLDRRERWLADAAAALAAPDDDLDAERAVMAQHYAAPPAARPYQPGDPDPLRDGLYAGWHAHRRKA